MSRAVLSVNHLSISELNHFCLEAPQKPTWTAHVSSMCLSCQNEPKSAIWFLCLSFLLEHPKIEALHQAYLIQSDHEGRHVLTNAHE
jgi:hypothetical protein